jgi:hypothetical protein
MAKPDFDHDEMAKANEAINEFLPHVPLTEEESRRICHKTDRTILVVLVWVYFLQILVGKQRALKQNNLISILVGSNISIIEFLNSYITNLRNVLKCRGILNSRFNFNFIYR